MHLFKECVYEEALVIDGHSNKNENSWNASECNKTIWEMTRVEIEKKLKGITIGKGQQH